ncbi:MAG TPA: sulfite exporter TauE/SafE family protein [Micropepsaceae bacterium]|nr:sulfite exporter TauE/SafE family protein [Micropepsaceae bacterium]
MTIEPAYMLSGLAVGAIVGLTGVGGGSLMTPLLILLFGIHPATAVGTDLLYAAVTKSVGTAVHGASHTVEWRIVGRLALGSVPATVLTLLLISWLHFDTATAGAMTTWILAPALCATAVVLLFRPLIDARFGQSLANVAPDRTRGFTIAIGAVLGALVSLSSVGAGALGATALMLLYPRLPVSRIVGSDIAHAVPLTLIAGIGHWYFGLTNLTILGWLLMGSIPGIILGSYAAPRIPDRVLRYTLAGTLLIAGTRLVL